MIQLTGSTGSLIKEYDYDAFGNEIDPNPADTNPFRYCGEYFDKETGTIYLRARYYDPAIGRFVSEDSVWGLKVKMTNGFEYDDPLSLNLYTYCYNNPINRFDPSGHFSLGSIFTGAFWTYVGVTAIVAGATALTIATGGAGAPALAAAITAGGTMIAGIGTAAFGVNEVVYGVTDKNLAYEYVFKGNEDAYMLTSALCTMGSYAGTSYCSTYSYKETVFRSATQGTSKAANKVDGLAKEMKDWLGKDAKVITNKSGDKVFMSSDGTRRIRFDINNTSPHSNPHGHVEQLVNGKWVKSGPLYPVDVPQN